MFQALQLLMYYFVGSELGVTNVLQRHFDWASNSLYYEEIPHARDPSRARFFLGAKDAILSAEVSSTEFRIYNRLLTSIHRGSKSI